MICRKLTPLHKLAYLTPFKGTYEGAKTLPVAMIKLFPIVAITETLNVFSHLAQQPF